MVEQKKVGALSHWVAGGTLSASAKRSAEQKVAELKLGRTKIWWGPSVIRWWEPLVQVQKGQWNKKWWN